MKTLFDTIWDEYLEWYMSAPVDNERVYLRRKLLSKYGYVLFRQHIDTLEHDIL